MKEFAAYLWNLPRTPVTEAVTALYEAADGLRKPSAEELVEFVSAASETEHRMRGDWDSNKDAIINESKGFIEGIDGGMLRAVTDGKGIVIYGEDDGKMCVYLLFVKPEYRRTGVAQKLLYYVKSEAGGMPITLSVNSRNDAARSLYSKIGLADYSKVGHDGYDIIKMQTPLTESVDPMTFNTYENIP